MSNTTSKTPRPDLAIPAEKEARDKIRGAVQTYCGNCTIVPPLSLEEIQAHADEVLRRLNLDPALRGFVTVLVGNEVWRSTVAAIPFDRRILLLPQCIRSSTACPAEFDALGLMCEECGRCSIGTVQREAEELGYAVLVAEGTTAVSELLARGEADAVVGVSCMEALERSFGPLTTHAVPGLAVPLLHNGCKDTDTDLDWLREVLLLKGPPRRDVVRMDIRALRSEVCAWFEPERLAGLLNLSGTSTEAIAVEWLGRSGKRWRPTLSACVFRALTDPGGTIPEAMRKIAVAVECFHKASLIHDDIEDGDELRNDTPTLHRQHGPAVALNVGDLLIGEGYRLIAESGLPPEQVTQMLAVAAEGHRTLCIGQGTELLLRETPAQLSVETVLDIHRRKTAPAFEVALQLGAICAGTDAATRAVLSAFSSALGIAYQVRDDLDDFAPAGAAARETRTQPFLLAALAREDSSTAAEERARELLRRYEQEAIRALRPLMHAPLKRLLYRLVARILGPTPPQ